MSLPSDLRVAFRTLGRTPGFFAMTTGVVALEPSAALRQTRGDVDTLTALGRT